MHFLYFSNSKLTLLKSMFEPTNEKLTAMVDQPQEALPPNGKG